MLLFYCISPASARSFVLRSLCCRPHLSAFWPPLFRFVHACSCFIRLLLNLPPHSPLPVERQEPSPFPLLTSSPFRFSLSLILSAFSRPDRPLVPILPFPIRSGFSIFLLSLSTIGSSSPLYRPLPHPIRSAPFLSRLHVCLTGVWGLSICVVQDLLGIFLGYIALVGVLLAMLVVRFYLQV